MIWILLGLFACENEPIKIEKSTEKETIEVKVQPKEESAKQKTEEPKDTTVKADAATDEKQNAGEIHTQIGKKNVDIKYDHMEDIKGTEGGKKIQGLDIKIGNMNIKVDEVEVEGLKIEKKEAKK